jgi:hypothetical protein
LDIAEYPEADEIVVYDISSRLHRQQSQIQRIRQLIDCFIARVNRHYFIIAVFMTTPALTECKRRCVDCSLVAHAEDYFDNWGYDNWVFNFLVAASNSFTCRAAVSMFFVYISYPPNNDTVFYVAEVVVANALMIPIRELLDACGEHNKRDEKDLTADDMHQLHLYPGFTWRRWCGPGPGTENQGELFDMRGYDETDLQDPLAVSGYDTQ